MHMTTSHGVPTPADTFTTQAQNPAFGGTLQKWGWGDDMSQRSKTSVQLPVLENRAASPVIEQYAI